MIASERSWCRGVVLLGLEAPEAELEAAFAAAAEVADRQGLRGRPDDLRRRGAENGWPAGSNDDDERWTTWPSASSGW